MARNNVLAVVLALVPAAAIAQTDEIAWQNDYDAALELAKKENKPVLIDFYADWCGPCKMMDAQTFTDRQVIRRAGDFVTVKVDVDQNENVAYAYRIQSIPRTIVLNVHGEIVGDRIGFLGPQEYLAFLNDVAEFTHKKMDGQVVNVPGTRAETVAISGDTDEAELIELLGDADPGVRARAQEELLGRDAGQIERILDRALKHEYLGVRIAAYDVLARTLQGLEPEFDPWDGPGDAEVAASR